MSIDPGYWERLFALLAAEAILLSGLAFVWARGKASPRRRRKAWQAAMLGIGLLWAVELAGARRVVSDRLPGALEGGSVFRASVRVVEGSGTDPVATPRSPSGGEGATRGPGAGVDWPGGVWLLGVLVVLAGWLAGQAGLHWRHRRGLPVDPATQALADRLSRELGVKRVTLRLWPGLRGPLAFGMWRPRIALPADHRARFGSGHLEAVLAHELGHLAARDPLWLVVGHGVCALAWWHPAVWWARHRMQMEMEAAADEAASVIPGGPVALAEVLVAFGRELTVPARCRGLGVAGAGMRSELAGRVTRLLQPGTAWKPDSRRQAWRPVLLALTATTISLAAMSPVATVEPLGSVVLARIRAARELARGMPTHPTEPGERAGTALAEAGPSGALDPGWDPAGAPRGSGNSEPVPAGNAVSELNPAARATAGITERSDPLRRSPAAPVPAESPAGLMEVALASPPSPPPAPASASAPGVHPAPEVRLRIRIFDVPEPVAGKTEPGGMTSRDLDRLFESLPDTESPVFTESPTGDYPGAGSDRAAGIRMDRSRVEGQARVLDSVAVASLERRLDSAKTVKAMASPTVWTASGRSARVQVSEVRSVVTGVAIRDGTSTNGPVVNYHSDPISLGPWVEVNPVWVSGGRWDVGIIARVSEFLGYDDPGAVKLQALAGDGKSEPISAQLPLPRLRVREVAGAGTLATGDAVLLRGPMAEDVSRTRRGWFRAPRTEAVRRRLYILVTQPEVPPAQP